MAGDLMSGREFADRYLSGPKPKQRPTPEEIKRADAAFSAPASDPYTTDPFAGAIAETNASPELFAAANFGRTTQEIKDGRRALARQRAEVAAERAKPTRSRPAEQVEETDDDDEFEFKLEPIDEAEPGVVGEDEAATVEDLNKWLDGEDVVSGGEWWDE